MVWSLGVFQGIWRVLFWFRVFKGSGCGVEGVRFSIVLWVQGLEGFPGFEAEPQPNHSQFAATPYRNYRQIMGPFGIQLHA